MLDDRDVLASRINQPIMAGDTCGGSSEGTAHKGRITDPRTDRTGGRPCTAAIQSDGTNGTEGTVASVEQAGAIPRGIGIRIGRITHASAIPWPREDRFFAATIGPCSRSTTRVRLTGPWWAFSACEPDAGAKDYAKHAGAGRA